jgi:hypothetical protein
MKKEKIKISIIAISSFLFFGGCANKVNTNNIDSNEKDSKLRTVINYDNNVKSKVVPPTALKAIIYPIGDEKSGSYTDKQEVYYWVSKAKFRNEKKIKEIEVDSKIKKFLEE